MSWETVRLGDVCSKIGSGATPKGGSTVYVEEGVSFIRSQNVYNLSFDYSGLVHISDEAAYRLKGVAIEENDVLLNITGDSVARTCIAPREVMPARVNQHVAIVRPNDKVLNPIFLNYYLASPFMQAFMLGLAVGKGASRNAMTKEMIAGFEVPCPSVDTQSKIADILQSYDNLIDNNHRQIVLLEEAAQRLYREWLVDLRFPGYENTKIVDSVPEGWEEKQLSDFADVVMGQSPKSEFYNREKRGLPFHQGVGGYGDRFVKDETYSTAYTRVAEAGSILFSVRAPVGRLNLTKHRVVIGRGLSAINHKDGLQSFLYYLLKGRFFKDNIIGNDSIFASINKEELLSQAFLIPTHDVVRKFDHISSAIDRRIDALDVQTKMLMEARDRLLPKLMSGEIAV